MSIPVTIVDSEPSEYDGVIYDHDVTVELSDGTRFGAFDKDATIDETLIGETTEVIFSLLVRPECIKQIDDGTPRIEPNPDEPLSWNNHRFYGQVVKRPTAKGLFSDEVCGIILDVGGGTVQFELGENVWTDIGLGQFLKVKADRTDIHADSEKI